MWKCMNLTWLVITYVKLIGAREMAKTVRAPAHIDEQFVAHSTTKGQDHKGTWRDVAMNGMVKMIV